MNPPRVRFAPSPTGRIHIGNLRTAIFNWLLARREGGAFLLRLEDTDRERSTPEAVRAVLDTLEWMELRPDEPPVYQSRRTERHLEIAEQLLASGHAYLDDKGRPDAGRAVLFRMPGHDMTFHDEIRGDLRKPAESLKDFVIVRSNGTPVFHLANVVDDIDMNVNFVVRGDDHIENTYRHCAIYQALGAPLPRFAHLPMLVNERGRPFSKRDGDAFVEDYRARGFLPQALLNFLALLGWSPGDDREFMTREELVEAFDLRRVQSSPARVNQEKLRWLNARHMERLPREVFRRRLRDVLAEHGIEAGDDDYLARVAELMQSRVKVFEEAPAMTSFFFLDDYPFDPRAVRKRLERPGADVLLEELLKRWEGLPRFDAETLEASLREIAAERDLSAGALIHPVRVAVSGLSTGPGLFDMLECLGRERSLARIRRAVERLRAGEPFPADPPPEKSAES